jgi:hypothetical protein
MAYYFVIRFLKLPRKRTMNPVFPFLLWKCNIPRQELCDFVGRVILDVGEDMA